MKFRTLLACVLALLIAAAGLASVVASAQNDTTSNNQDTNVINRDKASANLRAYVISRNAQGEATCRTATAAELTQLRQRSGDSHVIYAGAPSLDAPGAQSFRPDGLSKELRETLAPSAGLRVILHATASLNQNPTARNAFIVAANRWEALISTPITVVIDVDFGTSFFGTPYPSDVLGATATADDTQLYSDVRARLLANSPTGLEAQFYNALPAAGAGVPTERNNQPAKSLTVRLARPNSRALGLIPDITNPDAIPVGATDAGIGFNSAFLYDFSPDNGIDFNRIDFDSVATHEIGHALGFSSESGGAVYAPVSIWDVFRFRNGAASLGTFGIAPRIMTAGGTQVYFSGQTNTFGTQELRLSTGGPEGEVGDFNQSSHWKDDDLTGQYIGIMDPNIGEGERNPITTNDVNAIDSFGYSIGSPVPPPPAPPAAPPPPANDNFANATVVSGVSGALTGNSTGATRETNEPVMLPNDSRGFGGRSIWYRWTSPLNGTALFETQGSGYDTILAVSTGNSVGSLTRINQNDDLAPGETTASRVTFNVTAGVTYQIAVDGFNNGGGVEFGVIQLNWSASGTIPPPTPATITGRFVENTTPLSGVVVGLMQGDTVLQQTTSGADGRWSLTAAFLGESYTLLFVRSGFSFTPSSLNVLVNQTPKDVGDILAVRGNPIDESQFFVTTHYDDFLGRLPDSSGLAFWVNNIESCVFSLPCREVKRIDTSAAFFLSIEFQETGYLVYRAYKAAYGDAFDPTIITPGSPQGYPVPIIRRSEFLADTPIISQGVQVGVGNWQAQLEANKQAYMLAFVGRSRFTTAYPATMTADEFVTKLDQSAGGVLSPSEKATLIGVLGATPADDAKRAQVLRAVAQDSDLNARELNRAFVLMQFFGYLRRDANTGQDTNFAGYKFWLDKLNQFNGDFRAAEMVKSFLVSGEYRGRFGS